MIMTTQKYLSELHHDHREWKNLLSFYGEDLEIMKKRLEEISHKNSDREMHGWVERFQNKLIIQEEQIDILRTFTKLITILQNQNIMYWICFLIQVEQACMLVIR
jgi:hypothetical protein